MNPKDEPYERFGERFFRKNKAKTIKWPEDYDGLEILQFSCTQTRLSPYLQNKLIRKWCDLLPTLNKVKYLFFVSRMNQKIFEAICQMTNIEVLDTGWGGIKDLSKIKNLKSLRSLSLRSSPIESIETLVSLKTLENLTLSNLKRIQNFRTLSALPNLVELSISGSMGSTLYLNTIKDLAELKNLKSLNLSNTRIRDKNIRILANLKKLEILDLPYWYKKDDFEYLYDNLPSLRKGSPIDVMKDGYPALGEGCS